MKEELSKGQLLNKIAELEKENEILALKLNRVLVRHKSRIEEFKSNIHLSYFNKALEKLAFYMYIKDQDGRYTYSNQKLLDLFNITRKDLYGKDDTHFHSETAKYIQEIDKAVLKEGKPTENEITITLPDNSKRTYKEVKTPIFDHIDETKIIGLLGISLDITEIKESEKILKKSENELRQFNQTKDRLLSILAHDLKTPFDNILSLSELILEGIKNNNFEEIRKWAIMIKEASQLGTHLLYDLFQWVESQSGQMEFNPIPLLISEVINEAIGAHKISASKKSIEIFNNVPSDLLLRVDRAMMAVVFRNLISNAIKFTYKGGNVSISAAASPESVILKVKDSGMGIEPKRIEDLFSPHKNLSTQGTYQEKGTGLGLVLCKEFIDKHNGEIWVESEEGMGSEFFIKLFQ